MSQEKNWMQSLIRSIISENSEGDIGDGIPVFNIDTE